MTLHQDHEAVQENIEKVMNGEDVKVMFPVSHNEKLLQLQDVKKRNGGWSLINWRDFLLVEHSL